MDIVRLLALVLRCNNFEFNNKHYLQISGVAMGTKAAPTIANLHIDEFEDNHIYTYPLQPLFYGRFIDDGFFIWQHGLMELMKFLHHLNNVSNSIKFTWDISANEISYLDLIVRLNPEGNISTSLYTKETDTQSYLHYTSSHPQHVKYGGPYSQLTRVRRLCSDYTDFLQKASEVYQHFKNRGYPESLLNKALEKAKSMNRQSLLNPARDPTPKNDSETFLVTTYNPSNPSFKKILDRNKPILESSTQWQHISKIKVRHGSRRNKKSPKTPYQSKNSQTQGNYSREPTPSLP